MLRTRIHRNVGYTLRKREDGLFVAAFKGNRGELITVTNSKMRVAEACIKVHIDDMRDEEGNER